MVQLYVGSILLAIATCSASGTVHITSPPARATTAPEATSVSRVEGWRSDLAMFEETLATKHKDAFTVVSRDRFEAAVDVLAARLDGLSDLEIVFELRRLVAMVGDAHTSLGDQKRRYKTSLYPISVLLLADGVYVTASTPQHRSLLGRRITHIGDATIDDVIARLGSLVSHENDAWLRVQVKNLLITPEALRFAGLVEEDLRAEFSLVDAAGAGTKESLSPMQPGQRQAPAVELSQEKLASTLTARVGGAIYGSTMLPDSRDLYVWYDACRNAADKTVAQFAQETLETIDREKPQRVMIDLRRNSGGNSALIQPLIAGIAKREDINAKGRLFVFIGGGTFSSGLWAAEDFKKRTNATLVGTPTGGKPNSFGEQRSVELPYSGLTLFYSTKKWVRDSNADPASLDPHVVAEPTWADLTAGRDIVIDAARAIQTDS